MYPITLIGSGNLAWHLGQALHHAGHRITEVFSRNLENAEKLAAILGDAAPTSNLNFSQSKAQIFIVAVKDDALASVIAELTLPAAAVLAHTSGTQPINLIQKHNIFSAVFYPLQTFTKAKQVNFAEIPIFIEATEETAYQILEQIAKSMSKQVHRLGSEQRQTLHLAAVFSCNFSNYLFIIAKQILEKQQIPFDLLKPLVSETVEKAFALSPENAQTGPARREDNELIAKHLTLLKERENDKNWQKIYELISKGISDFYTQKDH